MIQALILVFSLLIPVADAADVGRHIYLQGTDAEGKPIKAIINGLVTDMALPCANCHRESGLGTSESGRTIPPVSWRFLGEKQPPDDSSRFYSMQNKRPAYTPALVHRILTQGINSKGGPVDPIMPLYQINEQQTKELVGYLKMLFPSDDPGVDGEIIKIATIVDSRLSSTETQQHLEFIKGLFAMKNAGTRGELKRKKYSPIQKVPQYEAYRHWQLQVWKLSADPDRWQQELKQYYQEQPVFVVFAPLVKDSYSRLQLFCNEQKLPCLLPHRAEGSKGDYYNFVYQDIAKLRRDYLADRRRSDPGKLLFVDTQGQVQAVQSKQVEIPVLTSENFQALVDQYDDFCADDHTLLVTVDKTTAPRLSELTCHADQKIKIKVLADVSMGYQDIAEILESGTEPNICWVTNYDRVLKRNLREVRVRVLTRKFGLQPTYDEILARDLYAFGLLTDSMHQLAGNFSRVYLMEVIEHMLNSYPNFTYYSSVSGAPNQRAIVGSFKEFCPGERVT